jgi:hypothetical protein
MNGISSRLALDARVMTRRIQRTIEGHCTIIRLSDELVSSQREALLEETEVTTTPSHWISSSFCAVQLLEKIGGASSSVCIDINVPKCRRRLGPSEWRPGLGIKTHCQHPFELCDRLQTEFPGLLDA